LLPDLSSVELHELRTQLRSRSRGVGYRAAEQLAQAGPAGRQMLLRALESRDRNVRLHAAWAVRLLDSSEAVLRLVQLLREDREFYLPLQQALPASPDPALLETLIRASRDRANPNRKFHNMLLGDLPAGAVLDVLLENLQADDHELQEGAFLALKHARPDLRRQAARYLVQALAVRLPLPRHLIPGWRRRQRAAQAVPLVLMEAVGVAAGEEGVGVLLEILRSDAHATYRNAAIAALVAVGEAAAARSWRALADLVELPGEGDLPAEAAEALRRLRVTEAEERLLALLEKGKPHQRRNAAHALEGCGGPQAVPALTEHLLRDPDVHVRRTCARTLGRLPDPRAVGPLISALGDRDYWTGWNAAWALGQFKDPRLLPPLLAGLEDRNPRVRQMCAEALGQMGISTPEAHEALVAVLGEDRPAVARSASWALRQLDVGEALGYTMQLLESPDIRQRRIGIKARFWLRPERASYHPHLPVRSSARLGVVSAPAEARQDDGAGGPVPLQGQDFF
jgi:HEAT repeat protein